MFNQLTVDLLAILISFNFFRQMVLILLAVTCVVSMEDDIIIFMSDNFLCH